MLAGRQGHPCTSSDEGASGRGRPAGATHLHDEAVQAVAPAPRRVQLGEHHGVRSRLAHVANPEFGSFKVGCVYDEFLHQKK